MSDTVTRPVPISKILSEGSYYVLDEYAWKAELLDKITTAFMVGVEKLHGTAAREAIGRDGMKSMHRHFPVEKVRLLEDHLHKTLGDDLYYWSYLVGKNDLGIDNEFFVDHLIMFRIHYPYLVAKKAGKIQEPAYPFSEKFRAARADLGNPRMLAHRFRDFRRNRVGRWLGLLDETNSYTPEKYHQNVPRPARAHGAHIDTWYGHSFDGINLWLSVDGVNADNTVILYPGMFGHPVDYDPVSMYLRAGIPLSRPYKVRMEPGQLLVFNPETLHSTQVNISNETRFAITTRINPQTPRFNPDAGFHFQHWRSSKDLAEKRFGKLSVFPATQYTGRKSVPARSEPLVQKTIRVHSIEELREDEPMAVCPVSELPVGGKLAVDYANAKILVHRRGDDYDALSRTCPHRGIDLIDGYHDDDHIYCPGHGVAYSFRDGSSRCEAFSLRRYSAWSKDGMIYLSVNSAGGQ